MYYVYKITNLINQKIYIGKCINLEGRWNQHKSPIKYKSEYHSYIRKAINKHGIDNFRFEVLETFEQEQTSLDREVELIKIHESFGQKGYNLTKGGDGASGYKHTPESKIKMSKIKKIQFLGENNPFFGKKHTQETKNKIAKANSRFVKELNPFFGKKHSPESLAKMSQWQKQLTLEQIKEVREKYATGNYSRKILGNEYNLSITTIRKIIKNIKPYNV